MSGNVLGEWVGNLSGNSTNLWEYAYYSGGLCNLEKDASIYAIMLLFLAWFATLENIIIITVIFKTEELRSSSPILLLGVLSVIDLITACIVTPIKIWLTVVEGEYSSISSMIYTFRWLFYGVVFFSLSTVVMISIDRCLRVHFLDRYRLSHKDMIRGLVLAWIIPLTITISIAVKHELWLAWIILIYFILCIVIMLCCYVGMILALQKHSAVVNEETPEATVKVIEDQRRAVKTTLIIIVACIVMNLPPMVSLFSGRFESFYSTVLCAVTFFTLLGNSAVNPIIYCSRISSIQQNVLQCLHIRRIRRDEDDEYYLTVADEQDL